MVRARTGRFLSEDPIGLAGGINPYVFAGNDPINRRDPSGTDWKLSCVSTVSGKTCQWFWVEPNGEAFSDGGYDGQVYLQDCTGQGDPEHCTSAWLNQTPAEVRQVGPSCGATIAITAGYALLETAGVGQLYRGARAGLAILRVMRTNYKLKNRLANMETIIGWNWADLGTVAANTAKGYTFGTTGVLPTEALYAEASGALTNEVQSLGDVAVTLAKAFIPYGGTVEGLINIAKRCF